VIKRLITFEAPKFSALAAFLTAAALVNYLSTNPPSAGRELELFNLAIVANLVMVIPTCFWMVGMAMNLQGKRIQALETALAELKENTTE
jgi:hypothetical protein